MKINYQTYVSPASEVVEVRSEGFLATSGDFFGKEDDLADFEDGGVGF